MKYKKSLGSLITITADGVKSPFSVSTVMSQTLLKYSQKTSWDSYKIDNISQISDKFPPNENIYILAHDVSSDFPSHTHSFYEITYVCQGGIKNIIDGNEFYMSEGDLSILNPHAIQEIKSTCSYTLLINFCLKKEVFKRTLKYFYEDNNSISLFLRNKLPQQRNYMFFSLGHHLNIQTLISSIIQEYADSDFHQSFSLEALFLLLFSQLVKINEYSYYGIDDHTLKIINYIRANCIHSTLGKMAMEIGYNPSYLTTYIKKHTGRNCKDIINEARLNKAVNLLENSEFNISNIAEECGYRSVSHFHRIFKDKYDMTPNEYRELILRKAYVAR
ncbi:AraC-like DNA-binding protein [Mobilisporobacter senegalensis]|uniref:AraC-like DNA-binding protein n=1 Tax=Mobilisporobacter senegalensis TaxID=1329262 RepID=A0A3N1XVG6_9FIRM|nr:AraC family transcriptional regulator [Mobilisporobacter senegalensis]ROR30596.1 AraC-like DNA-binding protein [Mobilisporobacter senegalensis]